MRLTARGALFLVIPLLGAILIGVSVLVRTVPGGPIRRPRMEEGRGGARRVVDPGMALEDLRKAHRAAAGGSAGAAKKLRRAREDLANLEEKAAPKMREAILSKAEPAGLKMELVDLASEMKAPGAEAMLLAIFADRSAEEAMRTLALAKLTGRRSEAFFEALLKAYREEPGLGARHLVVKAIGESGRPEATGVLIEAAGKDPSASVRIQALESLGGRIEEAGALEAAREALRGGGSENVRLAALSAMARSKDASVEQTLREVAENPDAPARLREAARRWLAERARR